MFKYNQCRKYRLFNMVIEKYYILYFNRKKIFFEDHFSTYYHRYNKNKNK